MNYQKLKISDIRPPSKTSFESVHIDLRAKSCGNKPFTCLHWSAFFDDWKYLKIIFTQKKQFNIIALRQLFIPNHRDFRKQRGSGFGEFLQVLTRKIWE